MFENKDYVRRSVDLYHIMKHQTYNVVQSHSKLWSIRCASSDNAQNYKSRLRATLLKNYGYFQITKYEGPHTCLFTGLSRDHKHVGGKMISTLVRHIVEKDPGVKVEAIVTAVNDQFQYTVSYRKAWCGKHKALVDIYGEWEPSYAKLPYYMAAFQYANPGTVVSWIFFQAVNSNVRVLNYIFWAFEPSIQGFMHCRPVISIDGTHLYGKFKGKMLIATGIDAENGIFSLAYAIVDEGTTVS